MIKFNANIKIKLEMSFDEQQLLIDIQRAGSHAEATYTTAHRFAFAAAHEAAEAAAVKAFEDTYVAAYAATFLSKDSQADRAGED
jgi:hypothetical protein